MNKYIKYIINYAMSYFYDVWYYFSEGIIQRIGADNYKVYKFSKKYPDYLKSGAAVDTIREHAKKIL